MESTVLCFGGAFGGCRKTHPGWHPPPALCLVEYHKRPPKSLGGFFQESGDPPAERGWWVWGGSRGGVHIPPVAGPMLGGLSSRGAGLHTNPGEGGVLKKGPYLGFVEKELPSPSRKWLPFAGQRPLRGLFCNLFDVAVKPYWVHLYSQNLDAFGGRGTPPNRASLPRWPGSGGPRNHLAWLLRSKLLIALISSTPTSCRGWEQEKYSPHVSRDCWAAAEEDRPERFSTGRPQHGPRGTDASTGRDQTCPLTTTWGFSSLRVVPQGSGGGHVDPFCWDFLGKGPPCHTLKRAPAFKATTQCPAVIQGVRSSG
ncbi:hypothetical protein GWK47_011777 [Chionoecetes opilio]|uniref:Uncharacterized protein n=1 Tax=Chionoecetes opilio TaxID=41210 RepID=A0A8J4XX95_CHIOP|nr:hypothetical protein GWK47_011777 [Chionoecetes opilio]